MEISKKEERLDRPLPWSRTPLRIDTRAVMIKRDEHKGRGSLPQLPGRDSALELDLNWTLNLQKKGRDDTRWSMKRGWGLTGEKAHS